MLSLGEQQHDLGDLIPPRGSIVLKCVEENAEVLGKFEHDFRPILKVYRENNISRFQNGMTDLSHINHEIALNMSSLKYLP